MRGLMVDVMDRVGLELGVQVHHEGYPWLRAQKLVRAGQADGFVTVPTRERRAYTRVVEAPVAFSPLTLFTQTGHPALARLNQARALSDLKAFTILDYIGNGWGKENLVGFKVHLTSNVDNVFKLLAAGRGGSDDHGSSGGALQAGSAGIGGDDHGSPPATGADAAPPLYCQLIPLRRQGGRVDSHLGATTAKW